jgi:GntR family phosphonate transport system transcriptional regulator
MEFERKRGEALWSQIAARLAQAIEQGAYKRDDKLPTEAQLAIDYGVNRHTIRRALEELAAARLIRTEHGRGSFVNDEVMDYHIGTRPRFSELVRRYNRTPLGDILQLELTQLGELPEAAAAGPVLGLREEAPVILLERLGTAEAKPISLSRHIFPSSRLPGLMASLQGHGSITAALAAIGVDDYTRRWTRVGARLPDAREARLLRVARTDALLTTESANENKDGVIIEYGTACYPSTRMQLVFEP